MQPGAFGALTDNALAKTIKSSTLESCLGLHIKSMRYHHVEWASWRKRHSWQADAQAWRHLCLARLLPSAQTWSTQRGNVCKQNTHILYSAIPCHVILMQTKTTKKQNHHFKLLNSKDKLSRRTVRWFQRFAWLIRVEKTSSWDHRLINNPFLHCKKIKVLLVPFGVPEVSSSQCSLEPGNLEPGNLVPGTRSLWTTACSAPTVQHHTVRALGC